MEIQKQTIVDKIEVLENGCIQVRTATRIIEGEKTLGQSFHRHVVNPGDDYGNEDARVQVICAATHTPEVIDAFKAAIAAQGA